MTLHTSHERTSQNHSTHPKLLINTALKLTHIGISVVATDAGKLPVIKWGPFQERIATDDEVIAMFTHPKAQGIAMIGGRVSGNLFTLDFEGKDHDHNPMPSVYPLWAEMAQAELARLGMADLFFKIPVITTQHGGYHAKWCVVESVALGNEKLAKRWVVNTETGSILTDKNGKPIADLLIESKGEGGYALCPPSKGYELIQGDLTQIPIFPIGVHELLVSIAKSFHTAIESKARVTSSPHESKTKATDAGGLKPGDDYNQRGDWRSVLQRAGWELVMTRSEQEYWKRPGTSNRWSATFSTKHNLFYVFSNNASPFEPERAYSPFVIYALIKHDGDFSAAAKDLAAQGYGSQHHSKGNGHQRQASHKGSDTPFTATPQPGGNGSGRNGSGGSHGASHQQDEAKDPGGENESQSLIDAFYKAKESDFFDLRPPVIVNNRQMRHVITDMQEILREYDGEPLIYQKNGRLVRVKFMEERAQMDYFTKDTLAVTLNEYADFYKARETKEGVFFTSMEPPLYLAKGILYAPRHHVPSLDFISASPLFAPDGSVAMEQGYNPKVKAYLHLADDLKVTDAEIDPTPENVEKSKTLIEEMIAEFPFEGEASRENAISLLLLPFLRPLINAEIPLYVCDSSDPGTGKGLLIDSLLTPYLSHRPISNSEITGDEWRKQLTTLLEHNPDVIYFDNAHTLDSTALASALTKGFWQDRRLGKNELVTSEIRAIFVANGNNVDISGEITRRVVWIRMVPNTEDPEEREFRIADLRQWVADHRRELIIAALTLINNWVKGGMREGELRLGSFERWAAIMSGVMTANGYDQFMTNIPQLKSRVDKNRSAMREFVTAWHNEHGTHEVTASQLFRLASMECDEDSGEEVGQGILSEQLTSNTRRGRANQLRNLLRKNTDRTFRLVSSEPDAEAIQCKIESTNKRHNGYMVYKLTEIRLESELHTSAHSASEPHFVAHVEHSQNGEQGEFKTHREAADFQGGMNAHAQSDDASERRTTPQEEAAPQASESKDDETGSLGETRFTSETPNPDGDKVSAQVNLKGNDEKPSSPDVDSARGSLSGETSGKWEQVFASENPFITEWYTVYSSRYINEATARKIAQAVSFDLAPELQNVLGEVYGVPDGKTVTIVSVVDKGRVLGYILREATER